MLKRRIRNSKNLGPVFRAECLALPCNPDRSSRVGLLFFLRCPNAIGRFVVAAIILAFKAVLGGRSKTHIGKEIAESHPSFANLYAPAAIVRICIVIRIVAATLHAVPSAVFSRLPHAVLRAGLDRLALKAAARLAETEHNHFCLCRDNAATRTATGPEVDRVVGSWPGMRVAQHGPAIERLPARRIEIFTRWHLPQLYHQRRWVLGFSET